MDDDIEAEVSARLEAHRPRVRSQVQEERAAKRQVDRIEEARWLLKKHGYTTIAAIPWLVWPCILLGIAWPICWLFAR